MIPHPRPDARVRLFCFPYAGAGPSIYHSWAKLAPASMELCAVQPPGREGRFRDPPFRSMEPLLQHLELELLPYLDRPFAFFGHSMGALVAFELARRLALRGLPIPCHVFVSASRAPHLADTAKTYNLPDQRLIEILRRGQGTPAELLVNSETLLFFLPCLRADLEVIETHIHVKGEPLACPISAFGGLHDPRVLPYHLAAWERYSRGRFKLVMRPGGHFFLQRERNAIMAAVQRELQAVLAP